MRRFTIQWGIAGLVLLSIAGCGGGSSESVVAAPPVSSPVVKAAIDSASSVATNDTAINSSASFTVLQDAGLPAVTVNSPPVVNFAVFSDGKVISDLVAGGNVRFAIAKLVPGTNGDPDQWVSYITRTESTSGLNNNGTGANGVAKLASAVQANTETSAANRLVFNPDGYYTYTFSKDITTGVAPYDYQPSLTHRVAIQLSYKNAAGETVLVNPYFDFTIVNGKSVPVTDPSNTRKMADVSSCNGCHEKLALHGGGRVDVQYCVMCHNPNTKDANSGEVLTLSTMVHKIHAGKLLKSKGEPDYVIWGYQDLKSTNPTGKHDYSEVGFPQDLRNCTVCHTGANPKTPQGDNWKTKPSKEACLSCHSSKVGSTWEVGHKPYITGGVALNLTNQTCAGCHRAEFNLSAERAHWNQTQENSAKYKMNIESAVFNDTADKKGRTVTVKYFLSDPTNANKAYNLLTSDCTFAGTAGKCVPAGNRPTINAKFGNLRFYLAYQNMVGQPTAVTEFSAYNNGGSGATAYAHMGTDDLGNNHYSINIPVPNDTLTAIAAGTARIVSTGQIKEPKLKATSEKEPRAAISPQVLVNTVVQHTYKDVVISGENTNPRRVIVSNEKCNVCHGALGTTTGSNVLAETLHDGARNTIEACVLCHDANRASSTIMTNGFGLNESYQFKRMIHGIHGNSERTYPFTHGNLVNGAFGKDGLLLLDGVTPMTSGTVNYAAEVAWPGVGINCNACHVNNSYMQDLGPLGASVSPRVAGADPWGYKVISPKAATCTACHDSSKAIGHVTTFSDPPASFGDKTQAQIAGLPREGCDDCHASGKFKGVDIVHGQK